MVTIDDDDPYSGRFSEEAPGTSPTERQNTPSNSSMRKEAKKRESQAELSSKMEESKRNAEEAGGRDARKLFEGFLQGIGRRAAEFVWDTVTGNRGGS